MQTMPINFAKTGEKVEIVNTIAGKQMDKKLMEMGLNTGSKVDIIKNDGGSLILGIGGSKLAIGQGMGHKIMVKPM